MRRGVGSAWRPSWSSSFRGPSSGPRCSGCPRHPPAADDGSSWINARATLDNERGTSGVHHGRRSLTRDRQRAGSAPGAATTEHGPRTKGRRLIRIAPPRAKARKKHDHDRLERDSRPAGGVGHRPRRRDDEHPARLLHGDRIIATARRAVGVRDTVLGDPRPPDRPRRAARSPPAGPTATGLVRAVREVVEEVVAADRHARRDRRRADGPPGRGSSPPACSPRKSGWSPSRTSRPRRGSTTWPGRGRREPARGRRPADPRRPGGPHPRGRRARRLVRGRRDARRGVRDVRRLAALMPPTGGSHPAQGRSSSGPARTPSSSRSTPRAGSRGVIRRWPASSSRPSRSIRCWRPACPRPCPTTPTRMPRPPVPAPSSEAAPAAPRSSSGSPR